MGIYNTLSFLFEGKRWDDHTVHIGSRTEGQVVALQSFLETVAAHADEIRDAVHHARDSLAAGGAELPPLHIRQDYVPDPERATISYPIFDLRTWTSRDAELDNFHSRVVPLLTVDRPWGYAIPADQTELIGLLERHRVDSVRLSSAQQARVERYRIEEVTAATVEDKEADEISVRVVGEDLELQAGTVVVSLHQPAANLIPLLLEPQSLWAPFGERGGRHLALDALIEVGTTFPVVRIVEPMEIP